MVVTMPGKNIIEGETGSGKKKEDKAERKNGKGEKRNAKEKRRRVF